MKQSRFMSALETTLSTAAGFGLSLFLQWMILPLLVGVPIPLHTNLAFAAIMTVASLVRGFVLRRAFEAFHIRRPVSPFMSAVIAERFRQIEQEGWSTEHDDAHDRGELARAAGAYLLHAGTESKTVPHEWPWDGSWWKPQGRRRDLVRGGALLIAEGERFDRARKGRR
ncbi:hypothetical protein ACE10Z_23485 [Bradyrhizobium sp. Pha-3]|uniref:DUF7220 family protein n=1 Tax=Bradyrhizobium sp. Pha-3 TaxID=208375 RepID=UPI0035D4137D